MGDAKGYPRVYAIGDCNYSCIPEEGYFGEANLKKQPLALKPIPKISYPGEEEAVITCANLKISDKILYQNKKFDFFDDPYRLHNMHWPWGAGMFATSLGPDDACFVLHANPRPNSGYTVVWGYLCAWQKWFIEWSKVDQCREGII